MAWTRSGGWLLVAVSMIAPLSAQAPGAAFEVASVKKLDKPAPPSKVPARPGVFYRPSTTLASLVLFAYDIRDYELIGGPEWIRRDPFEIDARAAGDVPPEEMRQMVRALLEDRFALVIRREQRELRGSSLVMARKDGRPGAGLERCDDPQAPAPPSSPVRIPPGSYPFMGRCQPLSAVARNVSALLAAPVVDRTGLAGLWSFTFFYLGPQPLPPGRERDLADQENVPTLATALKEYLGLELEPLRGPFDVLVIESVQQPTEN